MAREVNNYRTMKVGVMVEFVGGCDKVEFNSIGNNFNP